MLRIIKENRKLRKENAQLCRAIEETLQELEDEGFTNKSILIMSVSIRLERALKKDPEELQLNRIQKSNSLSQPYCKAE